MHSSHATSCNSLPAKFFVAKHFAAAQGILIRSGSTLGEVDANFFTICHSAKTLDNLHEIAAGFEFDVANISHRSRPPETLLSVVVELFSNLFFQRFEKSVAELVQRAVRADMWISGNSSGVVDMCRIFIDVIASWETNEFLKLDHDKCWSSVAACIQESFQNHFVNYLSSEGFLCKFYCLSFSHPISCKCQYEWSACQSVGQHFRSLTSRSSADDVGTSASMLVERPRGQQLLVPEVIERACLQFDMPVCLSFQCAVFTAGLSRFAFCTICC